MLPPESGWPRQGWVPSRVSEPYSPVPPAASETLGRPRPNIPTQLASPAQLASRANLHRDLLGQLASRAAPPAAP